jgi:hypothetical protein
MSPSPENWFYVREGRRRGPFDRGTLLRELLALDEPETTLVWRKGLPGWTKVGLLDELRPEIPPPVPTSPPPAELGLPGLEAVATETSDPKEPSPDPPLSDPPLDGTVPSRGEGEASTAPAGEEGEAYVFDVATAANQLAQEGSPEEKEQRRRRRRRHRPVTLPRYLLPLVILFVTVVLGLWLLLRRVNEVPPGQIIQQGALSEPRPHALPG